MILSAAGTLAGFGDFQLSNDLIDVVGVAVYRERDWTAA
jgi:hypothetical protein